MHDYLTRWNYDGTIERIHHALYVLCREAAGRHASPTAGVIDSQSVKSAEKGGARSDLSGYSGKKVMGKKRHILVDTSGLLLHAIIHPAMSKTAMAARCTARSVRDASIFAQAVCGAGYQGPKFANAVAKHLPQLAVEIVKRSEQAKGFEVLPMRWVVERTLAWLNRCRRLAKDFENLTDNALAFLRLASIRLMLRQLCGMRHGPRPGVRLAEVRPAEVRVVEVRPAEALPRSAPPPRAGSMSGLSRRHHALSNATCCSFSPRGLWEQTFPTGSLSVADIGPKWPEDGQALRSAATSTDEISLATVRHRA